MSQIKSFTISLPIDTISFNQCLITDIDKLDKNQLQALKSLATIDGKITYEKPQILKRPDGSVISVPDKKDFEDYLFIDIVYGINYELSVCLPEWINILFAEGKVFLAEDRHLAEKKAKQLTKQLEIQYEIDTLNAKEGETNEHKKVFCYDEETDKVYLDWADARSKPKTEVSKATAKTILAKYSQDELKLYLGIIL